MKKIILSTGLIALVLALAGVAKADTVELNLFDLGCPTTFNSNSPYWQTNFDLGVTFSEISHVYIDWSGEITGALVQPVDPQTYEPVGDPYSIDVAISAYLDMPIHAGTSVWGGQDTYPASESFERLSDYHLFGLGTWSGLLDGKATVWLFYETSLAGDGHFIESGSIVLDKANLVVEGIIPEPSSLCLIGLGCLWITRKSRK